MSKVTGEYPDGYSQKVKIDFSLNADQAMNPFTWEPPIHWSGIVDGKKVKFTQIHSTGSSKHHFDWSDFPEELATAIPYIVDAINKAMKVMD